MEDLILEAHDLVKLFPGVVALDKVDIACRKGTVHCVVGENGAGKSTLVKILTGIYRPDGGTVRIGDANVFEHHEAFEKVSYVPQELQLFEYVTVAENLLLPLLKSGKLNSAFWSKGKIFSIAAPLLEKFHIREKPDRIVHDIPPSSKQLLQIARALVLEDREIIILDEPTTSLTAEDAELLFKILRKLRNEGKAIIYISHKLDEVLAIGDEITVLRDGKRVGHGEVGEVDKNWIVQMMSGRTIDERATFRSQKVGEVILEVKNLSGPGFSNVSFEVRRGEILGFYGLVGAGRSEIAQTLLGYRIIVDGEIRLGGKSIRPRSPYFAIREGLFYLPEERKQQGIFPSLSVRHNVGVTLGEKILNGFFVSLAKERLLTEEMIRIYSVKTSSTEVPIKFLSGGNQQKVIVGRSVFCPFSPKVLIFDEPTKGIDIMAKGEIYKIMKSLAEEKQVGIILISSELEELLKCCNRILTIYRGRITGEFDPENVQVSEIISATINAFTERATESGVNI
ncbi:MAG: sugar ABC transporter ATP-binding protein [Candidatus Caldatribacteriaceae bacterium]